MPVGDQNERAYSQDLTGGLETRLPPTRVPLTHSPDLLNVQLNNGAVCKRGGFIPYVKEHARLNAVENVGTRRAVMSGESIATALTVPGSMLAGDRPHYEAGLQNGFTLDFFVKPSDLTSKIQSLRARNRLLETVISNPDDDNALLIRPIISKGPSKRTLIQFRDAITSVSGGSSFQGELYERGAAGFRGESPSQSLWDMTSRYGPSGEILEASFSQTGTVVTASLRQPQDSSAAQVSLGDSILVHITGQDVIAATVTAADPFSVTFDPGFSLSVPNGTRGSIRTVPKSLGHGVPFFVYLFNRGTADAPEWVWKFAGHYRTDVSTSITSGQFRIFNVENDSARTLPRVGALYHIQASCNYAQSQVFLRVGIWNTVTRVFDYTQSSTLDGALSTGFGGTSLAPLNPCGPIQVFDCPIALIEDTALFSTTAVWDAASFGSRPPGLGFPQSSQTGYFACVRRFEGSIDDIAVWGTPFSSSADFAFNRQTKLTEAQRNRADLLNYWPMTDGTERLVREATGRGNHLYVCPDYPVHDPISGGVRSDTAGSWWFNGSTSYAIVDLEDNGNWSRRSNWSDDDNPARQPGSREAFFQRAVKQNAGFGIHIEFVPDAIEPFEQVLVEIAGVFRCVIRPDGRLAMYARDTQGLGSSPTRHAYVGAIYSRQKVVAGNRYNVTFAVGQGATPRAYIAFNGIADVSATFPGTLSASGNPVGALTIGMGSAEFLQETDYQIVSRSVPSSNRGDTTDVGGRVRFNVTDSSYYRSADLDIARHADEKRIDLFDALLPVNPVWQGLSGTKSISPIVNDGDEGRWANRTYNDPRSGFIGRIEQVKLLVGQALPVLSVAKDEGESDWTFETLRLHEAPDQAGGYGVTSGWTTFANVNYGDSQRSTIDSLDDGASPPAIGAGAGVNIIRPESGFAQELDSLTNDDPSAVGGIGSGISWRDALYLPEANVQFYHVIGRWVLGEPLDNSRTVGGRYRQGGEYSNSNKLYATTPTALGSLASARFAAEQRTDVEDTVGFLGPMVCRTLEPDVLSFLTVRRTSGLSTFLPPVEEYSYLRGRPYQELSPGEILPRFGVGLVPSNVKDARISLIADWTDTVSKERFVFTAAGRNLYWAKPIRRMDSPFPDQRSLWFFGETGDHVTAPSTSSTQRFIRESSAWVPHTVEVWVKPLRLDGDRIIAAVSDLTDTSAPIIRHNYVVGISNGSLFVAGTLNNGLDSWVYHEGTNRGIDVPFINGAEARVGTGSVLLNNWNHILVTIGDTTSRPLAVFVNGRRVTMSLLQGTGITSGYLAKGLVSDTDVPDLSVEGDPRLYIGGFPEGFELLSFPSRQSGSVASFNVQSRSFFGFITEFRSRPGVDANFPTTLLDVGGGQTRFPLGVIPRSRVTATQPSGYMLSLNESDGWVFRNNVTGLGENSAISQIKELILVKDNLADSRFARYDFVVSRDRLYLTNGESNPLEVSFRRFSHPDGPFRVQRVGMAAPVPPPEFNDEKEPFEVRTIELIAAGSPSTQRDGLRNRLPSSTQAVGLTAGPDDPPPEVYFSAATLNVFCSFVDEDGRESEPVFLDKFENPGLITSLVEVTDRPVAGTNTFQIQGGAGGGTTAAAHDLRIEIGIQLGLFGNSSIQPLDAPILVKVSGVSRMQDGWYLGRYVVNNFGSPLSEPYIYVTFPGTAAAGIPTPATSGRVEFYYSAWRINNLPRSTESQVVARRIYTSLDGGSREVQHSDIPDNITASVELSGQPATGNLSIEFLRRLPAPRARHIGVGGGTLFLANLRDVAAGGGALAFSDAEEQTYFPLTNLAVLDSEDGKEITGLASTLGRFYLSKRDSIWQFNSTGAASPIAGGLLLRPVNESVGIGGGFTVYDRAMYGAGERGVYMFDGSNVQYASPQLEGDWSRVDIGDEDLINQFGVFHRDDSQYWLSCRVEGQASNSRIYVLHQSGGSWSRWDVPPHTYLRGIVDPNTQRPEVVIGTDDGRLLIYDRETFVDGSEDNPGPVQIGAGSDRAALFVSGLVTTDPSELVLSTIPGLTEAGIFPQTSGLDVVRDGLRGITCVIQFLGAPVVAAARIIANTSNTIRFDIPLPPGAYLVTIGGYDAYWSTPWIGTPGYDTNIHSIDLEFDPSDANGYVQWISVVSPKEGQPERIPARNFLDTQTGAPPIKTVELSRGWLPRPLKAETNSRGRYVRMRFGTTNAILLSVGANGESQGIRNPWCLTGIGCRFKLEGHLGSGANA